MADVFLSYSRKDSDFVHKLHDTLARHACEVWVDWENIPLTAEWWSEICAGIEAAHSFVFVISPNSVASPVCNMEIDFARQSMKRLVPVVLTETDEKSAFERLVRHELDANMLSRLGGRDILNIARTNWQLLARHNWLIFDDELSFDHSFRKLIDAINTDLEHIKMHTRLLLHARDWENHNRSNSYLLGGDALHETDMWLAANAQKNMQASDLQLQYIMASQRYNRRRQRSLFSGITIALAIAIGLIALSSMMFGQAIQNLNNSNATEHALETENAHLITTIEVYQTQASTWSDVLMLTATAE